jgi:hypothetical protein
VNGIPLSWIGMAAERRLVSLPGELAGYLVLGVLDSLGSRCARAAGDDIELLEDGRVVLKMMVSCDIRSRDENLRSLLSALLAVACSLSPALSRAASAALDGVSPGFPEGLATALIPVNRGAARRALARLYREVAKVSAATGGGPSSEAPGATSRQHSPAPASGVDRTETESLGLENRAGFRAERLQRESSLAPASGIDRVATETPELENFGVSQVIGPPQESADRLCARVNANAVSKALSLPDVAVDDCTAVLPLVRRRRTVTAEVEPVQSEIELTTVDTVVEISDEEISYCEPIDAEPDGAVLADFRYGLAAPVEVEPLFRLSELPIVRSRSTLEQLSQQFVFEPLWSEAELCQKLRLVAGFDLTPGPRPCEPSIRS